MTRWTAAVLLFFSCISVFAGTNGVQNSSYAYSYDVIYHNPAGIVFPGRSLASAGSRLLWLGLEGDRLVEGFGGVSQPLGKRHALGIRGTLFSSHLYREGNASLLLGRLFLGGRVGLGANANLRVVSYDEGRFQLVDEGDPLLAGSLSRTAFSYGFGVVLRPFGRLLLGASFDHVNRPDVSLTGTGVRMRSSVKAGITLDTYGWKPQVELCLRGEDLLVQGGLRRVFLNPSLDVFAGIDFSNGGKGDLLVQAGYFPGSFGLRYDYQFPLNQLSSVTWGSHSIVLLFSGGGRVSGSIRPTIELTKPIQPVVRNEVVNAEGVIFHERGVTHVDILRNGEVVRRLAFDEPQRSVLMKEAVPLVAGDNVIRIVARAGRDERAETIQTRYRPYLRPPRIEILSAVPVASDTSEYRLRAEITDPNGLDRVMVYNNSRKLRRYDLRGEKAAFSLDLAIPLHEGLNFIILFAANREESRYEQLEILFRPD